MIQKNIRVRKSQKDFTDESAYSLSKLVRQHIEVVRDGEVEAPTGGRRSRDGEYKRTSIGIKADQEDFIQDNDINLSQLVDDAISRRIERDQKLDEIGE